MTHGPLAYCQETKNRTSVFVSAQVYTVDLCYLLPAALELPLDPCHRDQTSGLLMSPAQFASLKVGKVKLFKYFSPFSEQNRSVTLLITEKSVRTSAFFHKNLQIKSDIRIYVIMDSWISENL